MRKRVRETDTAGIDKIIKEIANNPLISTEELIIKARELGYDPADLIDKALGSVKYEKSSADLSKSLEDILNTVYENDPTPVNRYIIDPTSKKLVSPKAKNYAAKFTEDPNLLGFETNLDLGKSRKLPEDVVVKNMTGDMGKLQALTIAGHEIKHAENDLIRPNFKSQGNAFQPNHHYGDVYETSELVREVQGRPVDTKVINEIRKQASKNFLNKKVRPFTKLMSMLPVAGGIATALAAGNVEDALADTIVLGGVDKLGEGSDIFPGPEVTKYSPNPQLARASARELKMLEEFGKGEKVETPRDLARERMQQNMDAMETLDAELEVKKAKKRFGYE